jgi:hypothetical protein
MSSNSSVWIWAQRPPGLAGPFVGKGKSCHVGRVVVGNRQSERGSAIARDESATLIGLAPRTCRIHISLPAISSADSALRIAHDTQAITRSIIPVMLNEHSTSPKPQITIHIKLSYSISPHLNVSQVPPATPSAPPDQTARAPSGPLLLPVPFALSGQSANPCPNHTLCDAENSHSNGSSCHVLPSTRTNPIYSAPAPFSLPSFVRVPTLTWTLRHRGLS